MLVKLDETWIESSHVIAVRAVGDDATNVWCMGQSAVDGAFLIDLPVDEVMDILRTVQSQELAQQLLADLESSSGAAETH